jgi:hypothetical protein
MVAFEETGSESRTARDPGVSTATNEMSAAVDDLSSFATAVWMLAAALAVVGVCDMQVTSATHPTLLSPSLAESCDSGSIIGYDAVEIISADCASTRRRLSGSQDGSTLSSATGQDTAGIEGSADLSTGPSFSSCEAAGELIVVDGTDAVTDDGLLDDGVEVAGIAIGFAPLEIELVDVPCLMVNKETRLIRHLFHRLCFPYL